ncbi:MAG: hypothetical protein LBT01_07855 [Spirochaetaceae bacterium]|jgi:hypothetical protein|nr:hypothetical protein [Spirochaetaceae bacterium]
MDNAIFRKTSLERISSPEQLNDYIKVANPAVWMVLGAMLLALSSLVFWGISATIPTTVSAIAMAEGGGRYVCYFPPALGAGISPGMSVRVDGKEARVLEKGAAPLSFREAAEGLPSDYAAYALSLGEWNVKVRVVLNADFSGAAVSSQGRTSFPLTITAGVYVPLTITMAQTQPLDFLLK